MLTNELDKYSNNSNYCVYVTEYWNYNKKDGKFHYERSSTVTLFHKVIRFLVYHKIPHKTFYDPLFKLYILVTPSEYSKYCFQINLFKL